MATQPNGLLAKVCVLVSKCEMKHQLFTLFGLPLASLLLAAEGDPLDVKEYVERREICEHLRQEPWPEGTSLEEKERREFLAAQLVRQCQGSDKDLLELKKKYKNNQSVMKRLERYEAIIEGQQ